MQILLYCCTTVLYTLHAEQQTRQCHEHKWDLALWVASGVACSVDGASPCCPVLKKKMNNIPEGVTGTKGPGHCCLIVPEDGGVLIQAIRKVIHQCNWRQGQQVLIYLSRTVHNFVCLSTSGDNYFSLASWFVCRRYLHKRGFQPKNSSQKVVHKFWGCLGIHRKRSGHCWSREVWSPFVRSETSEDVSKVSVGFGVCRLSGSKEMKHTCEKSS